MAANYICIELKTKVYGKVKLTMMVILGVCVEYIRRAKKYA